MIKGLYPWVKARLFLCITSLLSKPHLIHPFLVQNETTCWGLLKKHPWLRVIIKVFPRYSDVIMGAVASQLTSLTIVYSTVYSDADQRKHQSSASLAFVWGIHRDRWIPRTKGQLRGKCLHLMTSSWKSVSIQMAQKFPHCPSLTLLSNDWSIMPHDFA